MRCIDYKHTKKASKRKRKQIKKDRQDNQKKEKDILKNKTLNFWI
jgi:hypothetical protein